MSDPLFGSPPQDLAALWDRLMNPAMLEDPEMLVWRQVVTELFQEHLEDLWAARWRAPLPYALEPDLKNWQTELGFICPAGWDIERCRAVLLAIYSNAYSNPTSERVWALVEAVLDGQGQAYMREYYPLHSDFVLDGVDEETAISMATVLNRARARGIRYSVKYHDGVGTPARPGNPWSGSRPYGSISTPPST